MSEHGADQAVVASRHFRSFLEAVCAAQTIPTALIALEEFAKNTFPDSCTCVWLLDREKLRATPLFHTRKADCEIKGGGHVLTMTMAAVEPVLPGRECVQAVALTSAPSRSGQCLFWPVSLTAESSLAMTVCSDEAIVLDGDSDVDLAASITARVVERINHATENRLLMDILHLSSTSTDLTALLDGLVSCVRDRLAADGCSVFLRFEGTGNLTLGATTGLLFPEGPPDALEYHVGEGLTGYVAASRLPLRIAESERERILGVGSQPKSVEVPDGDSRFAWFMGVPIMGSRRDEQQETPLLGVLRLHRQKGIPFLPQEEALCSAVGKAIGHSIETWQLADRSSMFSQGLVAVLQALHEVDDVELILGVIVAEARKLFSGSAAVLLELHAEDVLKVVAEEGYDASPLMGKEYATHSGLVGAAVRERRTIAVPDVRHDHRYLPVLPTVSSEICTPIEYRGERLGVLCVSSEQPKAFRPDDARTIALLEALSKQAAIALARARTARERDLSTQNLLRATQLVTASNVASGLAHELKNDLASIVALVQNVERDPSIKGKGVNLQNLDRLRQQTTELFQLAQRLLDLSRLDDIRRTDVFLNELIRETCTILKPLLASRRLSLELQLEQSLDAPLDGKGTPLRISRAHIGQVLRNLVLNAADASHKNQKVIVCTRRTAAHCEMIVRDFGVGMTSDERRQAFKLFYTTKQDGFGIGLHVAQMHVQQHGGTIEVESKHGAGSTFTVRIPLHAEEGSNGQ
jgi:signal transduction histidine kinase